MDDTHGLFGTSIHLMHLFNDATRPLCTIAMYPIPMVQKSIRLCLSRPAVEQACGSLPCWHHLIEKMPHSGIVNKYINRPCCFSNPRGLSHSPCIKKQSLCADTAMRRMTISSERMFYNINQNDAFKSFILVTNCHILSRTA
jgi:hypothetical protein